MDVLLIKDDAELCIDWLLHINSPYDDVTTEQMCLMMRNDSYVDLILERIEACKKQLVALENDKSPEA